MIGDMFKMETACGSIYLHHVGCNRMLGDVVAVHKRESVPVSENDLRNDVFALLFPIGTATRIGCCLKVGKAKIPQKFLDDRFRYPFHNLEGAFLYWVLIENGKERRGLKTLSTEEMSLPIAVAVNGIRLEELVCRGYKGGPYFP